MHKTKAHAGQEILLYHGEEIRTEGLQNVEWGSGRAMQEVLLHLFHACQVGQTLVEMQREQTSGDWVSTADLSAPQAPAAVSYRTHLVHMVQSMFQSVGREPEDDRIRPSEADGPPPPRRPPRRPSSPPPRKRRRRRKPPTCCGRSFPGGCERCGSFALESGTVTHQLIHARRPEEYLHFESCLSVAELLFMQLYAILETQRIASSTYGTQRGRGSGTPPPCG